MPTFPTELTDEIIAWIPAAYKLVIERYSTLLCCSLVCSAWLPASRYQLFQELWIGTAERYDLLVSRVLRSENMRSYLLFVRKVYFYTARDTFKGKSFVLEFAGHLPNVTLMTFYDGTLEGLSSHPSCFVAISRFSTIRTLSITDGQFPSFGDLRRTLSFLPSLTSLQLYYPSWPDPATALSPRLLHGASTVRRPALLGLNLSLGTDPPNRRRAQQFIAWLSETATSSSLLLLNMNCVVVLGSSLKGFGQGVRKMYVTAYEDDTEDLELFLSGLTTSLEVLHMTNDGALQPDTWLRFERLVHSLPRPTPLLELHIHFVCHGPPELSKFDGLKDLDEALQPELFEKLQAVKLEVGYIRDSTDREDGPALTGPILAVMMNKLPNLYERNIIEVSAYTFQHEPVRDVEPPTDPNDAPS
ncbi:hypothetical protein OH76DRAFT_196186 [Lentinus brumalis]|uniref:F-box domain-containing protein n=1 Tax=Lentinus brumalis TaxID=2498619 RepID=A0A371DI20_9APHY|nr:hypothetical protein OH76DRAFT_196186 [Polyporus brumalis]